MQGQRPIAGPPQFHTVALVDADQLHRVVDPAPLDPDVEGQLGRTGAAGQDQQQRHQPQHGPYRLDWTSAMRFQAEAGRASMPRLSQPFHGKSLSFTVRMKTGESRPAIESIPMFSIPLVNSALKYCRRIV